MVTSRKTSVLPSSTVSFELIFFFTDLVVKQCFTCVSEVSLNCTAFSWLQLFIIICVVLFLLYGQTQRGKRGQLHLVTDCVKWAVDIVSYPNRTNRNDVMADFVILANIVLFSKESIQYCIVVKLYLTLYV